MLSHDLQITMDPFQEEHNITGRTCIMYRPFHAPHVLFSDNFFFKLS